ncbi:hypothetical protein ASD62_05540 [Phycicoccus sp. Root563]|uniref:hypothetical protein n=1 Tax=Phycicoccus sp. Root563 TaxID=1736562 RepID=UPI00070316EC|nr:hypothetical protein [Phycicoccus sp. Root563]KQZ88847.1 hypothetical protein ASD62_05540 [Phycicoccus sp. Root563]
MTGWTRAWWVVLAGILALQAHLTRLSLASSSADALATVPDGSSYAWFGRDIPGYADYARLDDVSALAALLPIMVLVVAVAVRRSSRLVVLGVVLALASVLIGPLWWGPAAGSVATAVLVGAAGWSSKSAPVRWAGVAVGSLLGVTEVTAQVVGPGSGLHETRPAVLWAAAAVLVVRAVAGPAARAGDPAASTVVGRDLVGAAWAVVLAAGALHVALLAQASLEGVHAQVLALARPAGLVEEPETVTVAIAQFTGSTAHGSSSPWAFADPGGLAVVAAVLAVVAAWFLRREHRLVVVGAVLVLVGLLPWWPDGGVDPTPPIVRLLGFGVLGYAAILSHRGRETFGGNGTRVGS